VSAVTQTPGERACRLALGVEATLQAYSSKKDSDLTQGLYRMAFEGTDAVKKAIASGSLDEVEDVSARYTMWTAIFSAVAEHDHDELLSAGVALLEATQFLLESEVRRVMQVRAEALQA
jgi:hypothetical protein